MKEFLRVPEKFRTPLDNFRLRRGTLAREGLEYLENSISYKFMIQRNSSCTHERR